MDADGQLTAVAYIPLAEPIAATHFPTPSSDDDYDDLYSDVNLSGFLALPPFSPPYPTSAPKTPSPGLYARSPSPQPRRSPPPQPRPEPAPPGAEPRTVPPTPQYQPPLSAPKPPTPPHHQPPPSAPKPPTPPHHQPPLSAPNPPTARHQPRQRASAGSTTPSPPPATALYISELPWWTTDAEVEAALAPHGALCGLHFAADKSTGKSRGFCRADFLHPSAAASAAAALHGRVFHGQHCVASLSCPPAVHRDYDAPARAPAPTPAPIPVLNNSRGRGGGATARGNVGTLGDRSAQRPPTRSNVGTSGDRRAQGPPPRSMAPRPRAFGGDGGYGGFPSMGQCNAGMGTDMIPPMLAHNVNPGPAFFGARMAMGGPGVWQDQGMAGGLWDGQQPWNFGGCEMPWQPLRPPPQQHPAQQHYRNGDYGKTRGFGRERPGGRYEERNIGNARGLPERRQYGRGGGERSRDHSREERDRYRDNVFENERSRNQEYAECDDWERRGRVRSRSQSRDDDDDDDYPRRRR